MDKSSEVLNYEVVGLIIIFETSGCLTYSTLAAPVMTVFSQLHGKIWISVFWSFVMRPSPIYPLSYLIQEVTVHHISLGCRKLDFNFWNRTKWRI